MKFINYTNDGKITHVRSGDMLSLHIQSTQQ